MIRCHCIFCDSWFFIFLAIRRNWTVFALFFFIVHRLNTKKKNVGTFGCAFEKTFRSRCRETIEESHPQFVQFGWQCRRPFGGSQRVRKVAKFGHLEGVRKIRVVTGDSLRASFPHTHCLAFIIIICALTAASFLPQAQHTSLRTRKSCVECTRKYQRLFTSVWNWSSDCFVYTNAIQTNVNSGTLYDYDIASIHCGVHDSWQND